MKQPSKVSYVGLDVHKETIAIAVADGGSREAPRDLGAIPHDVPRLLQRLRRLGRPHELVCAYEAGPTGYGLQRRLQAEGVSCQVVAPSKTPVRSGDRVKTDRRDASKLASFLRSGDLTAVWVPDEPCEALRDLVRAREDARRARQTVRHQLSKFLLRHGRRFAGKSWSALHLRWIRTQHFAHEAQEAVLSDHLHEVERLTERVQGLEKKIQELQAKTRLAPLIQALQVLRGVRTLTAATIAFELGDLRRFERPRKLMAYLGLIPSESSSGERTRRGPITKTGNAHVRRALVESAWSYRFPPRRSPDMQARSRGVAPPVQQIAWKAQTRLHGRYRRLLSRGKNKQRVVVALARELAGFIWAIGQENKLLAS